MDNLVTNINKILFQTEETDISVSVLLKDNTLWLNLNQISELFERDKSVISRHLNNIFNEQELYRSSVVAFFATTASDNKTYQVEYFNLDAIISVGYRVNSKRGTEFRKWSNQILKDFIIQGYAINYTSASQDLVSNLRNTIELLSNTLKNQNLISQEGEVILEIILQYSKTWDLLLKYDENNLEQNLQTSSSIQLHYQDAMDAIKHLKQDLYLKQQATNLFGLERNNALEAILNNIEQTFDGIPLYDSAISKAAHLLYFIIKDHPFTDGNKRIGSFLFILYLKLNNHNINTIPNNSLVAIALLVAESNPSSKDTIIDLIINLIKN